MNKVALITGASSDIGSNIALLLAQNNINVIIHYNKNEEKAKEVKEKCQKYNVESLLVKADFTKENEIEDMIKKIILKFGKIDILINNAAVELNNDFFLKTKKDFEYVLNVNLIGTFLLTKYVSKYMLENKYGKIVNITSNNALNKYDPNTLEYDASKAGIISLTHNLAKELSPYINVNAIAPGWVLTEKIKELNDSLNGLLEKEECEKILTKRFVYPNEIAALVLFLISDDVSSINNQVITIDGGTI